MENLSALWRVRGCLPIPPEANDSGLISRVADIFEQKDAEILEEDGERIIFRGPFRWLYRYTWGLDMLDGGQVRRDNDMLRYELSTRSAILQALVTTPIAGLAVCAMGFSTGFALAFPLVVLCLGFLPQLVMVRLRVRPFLRRAFRI